MEIAILFCLTGILIVLGLLEEWSHLCNLRAIPIRIQVNGTRGKSTVTRLIASTLREAGIKTIAKTTGSATRLILENGEEVEIKRAGRPNIREQIRVVALAAKRGAQALVVECMALRPEYQWASEQRMIKSTIGVITNVRDDHLEIMGPTQAGVARALSNTIPYRGTIITAEKGYLPLLLDKAKSLHTQVLVTDPEELPQDLRKELPPLTFKENVAIVLKVCELLKIEREIALRGISKALPDPGALRVYRIKEQEKDLFLVNAFAANDPTSTEIIWEKLKVGGFLDRPAIAIYNSRKDRLPRASLFAQFLGKKRLVETILLVGERTNYVEGLLVKAGFSPVNIVNLGRLGPPEIMDRIFEITPQAVTVVGIGNIMDAGLALVKYWEEVAQVCG